MSAYILSNALVYLKDILPITAGVGATFRISPDLERGLDINTGGVNAFFILKSSTQIERYLITAVGGVATIVKRGLEQDGITENANLKKSWGDGSVGYITVKPDDFIALGKLDTAGGLRNTMGNALGMFEVTPSGVEVKRGITVGSGVPADTALIQYTDPTTREKSETTYSAIKDSIATAGKYIRSIPLGETLASATNLVKTNSTLDFIPFLTSNTGNADYQAINSNGTNAYQAFDSSGAGTQWASTSNGEQWVGILLTTAQICNAVSVSNANNSSCPATGWRVQGSDDGTSWTTLYTGVAQVPATKTKYAFTNTTAYNRYRIIATALNPTFILNLAECNFDKVEYGTTTKYAMAIVNGAISYANTLGSNIAGSRIKSGIRFSVPYNTTLGVVKTTQVSNSASARVQLYADDGTTLIAEQTPATSDTVTFPNITITANTAYRLVLNDSAYFQNQNNELILATYLANFPFAISGTLNGVNTVEPQNIKEINLGTKKAMKATASGTSEYAVFAGFLSGLLNKGNIVDLDCNDYSVISSFTGLPESTKFYVSNTAGLIESIPGTISRIVGYTITSSSELIQYNGDKLPGTTLTK